MTSAQTQEYWQQFHRFQMSRERFFAPKINSALKQQIQDFIQAYKRTEGIPENFVTIVPIVQAIKPIYYDAARVYGAKVLAYLPKQKARMPIGYNEMIIRLVEEYFSMDFLNTAQEITDTTKRDIANVLQQGFITGISFDEIVAILTSPQMTAIRARLIARTETVTAANFGANAAAQSTGLQLQKVWISAQDNRTRRIPRDKYDHLHMNGVTLQMQDLFNVNGELLQYPGDRKNGAGAGNICNCRCTHAFIPIRDNGRLVRNP